MSRDRPHRVRRRSTRSRCRRTSAAKRPSRSTPIFCIPHRKGKVLEDPWQQPPPEYVFHAHRFTGRGAGQGNGNRPSGSKRETPSALNGEKRCRRRRCSRALNDLGRDNGIGRVDLVENPLCRHEERGASTKRRAERSSLDAHRAIESLTLDREAAHLKDQLMPRYAELVYYGFWFAPEREMLQALVDKSQEQRRPEHGDTSGSTRATSSLPGGRAR